MWVRRDDGTAEVANGRRRLRGLRILNARRREAGKAIVKFWCVYRRMKDPLDHAEFRAIRAVSNLHEGDPPSEKAEAAARFIEEDKWPLEKVAPLFGWGVKQLENYLSLLEAIPSVRSAVDDGRLPIVAGAKIAGMPRKDQAAALEATMGARATGERKKSGAPTKAKSGRPPMALLKRVAGTKVELAGVDAAVLAGVRFATGAVTAEDLVSEYPNLAGLIKSPKKQAEATDEAATEAA